MDFKRGERKPCQLPDLGSVLGDTPQLSAHTCWWSRRRGCFFNAVQKKNTSRSLFLKWVFPHWSSALQRNEPGASGPPPGTSKLALCVWDINNNTVISLLVRCSTKIKQMNVDWRFHLWKMKIFTRTCVTRTQDHVI